METVLPTIFAIIGALFIVVITIMAVQVILVVREIKKTVRKINDTIASAEQKFDSLVTPLQNMGSMAGSVSSGMKIMEAFVGWLNRDRTSRKRK